MKALAWFTVIFNLIVVVLFVLQAAGMVSKPPFTALEDLLWALFSLPAVIVGFSVARQKKP